MNGDTKDDLILLDVEGLDVDREINQFIVN